MASMKRWKRASAKNDVQKKENAIINAYFKNAYTNSHYKHSNRNEQAEHEITQTSRQVTQFKLVTIVTTTHVTNVYSLSHSFEISIIAYGFSRNL